MLIPGKQAGPITAKTTEADLKKWYGAGNISQTETEGMRATVIFPKVPSKRILVFWSDTAQRRYPNYVKVEASNAWKSLWHFRNGVTIGTTLATLEKLNGGSFEVSGYGCDVGGLVHSWKGKALTKPLPHDLVDIQLSPGLNMDIKTNQDVVYNNLYGCDRHFDVLPENNTKAS